MKLLCSLLFSLFLISAAAQKSSQESAFADVKLFFEEKPFVVSGAVYRVYEMKLNGCTLEYKVHFLDQDSVKNKISVHRSYTIDISKLNPAYTKTLITGSSWVVLKSPSAAMTERILPDPKKNAVPKPIITRSITTAFLPIEFNVPKYEMALNKLISACKR